MKKDEKDIIQICFDVKTLIKLFSDYYSINSFAYMFDFINKCIDINETDS